MSTVEKLRLSCQHSNEQPITEPNTICDKMYVTTLKINY